LSSKPGIYLDEWEDVALRISHRVIKIIKDKGSAIVGLQLKIIKEPYPMPFAAFHLREPSKFHKAYGKLYDVFSDAVIIDYRVREGFKEVPSLPGNLVPLKQMKEHLRRVVEELYHKTMDILPEELRDKVKGPDDIMIFGGVIKAYWRSTWEDVVYDVYLSLNVLELEEVIKDLTHRLLNVFNNTVLSILIPEDLVVQDYTIEDGLLTVSLITREEIKLGEKIREILLGE